VLLAKQGNLSEAIEQQKKALQLDPEFVPAHLQLGVLYRNTKQFDSAISHLKEVLSANSGNVAARKQLTFAYFENKQYKEAWDEVHKLQDADIQMDPSFIKALASNMTDPGR